MIKVRRFVLLLAISLPMPAWVAALTFPEHNRASDRAGRPKLVLRVDQPEGLAPTRVALTADLVGGKDDEDFNCPTIEWDWDDGTESESTVDCRPYRAGMTEVVRHFAAEHLFEEEGEYCVILRLARHDTELASAEVNVLIK